MTTGYTADVGDGKVTDFRTFVLRCSRAFGATIMQRGNPLDELPTHRQETDYYEKLIAEVEAEIARLAAMTRDDALAAMHAENEAAAKRNEDMRRDREAKRERYEAMLAEAREWMPPTPEHVGLRDFMVKQLEESIAFDCGGTFSHPVYDDVDVWLTEKRSNAARDLAYATKHAAEERERDKEANAWIDALYESLPEAVTA